MKRVFLSLLVFCVQPSSAELGPAEYTGPLFREQENINKIIHDGSHDKAKLKKNHTYKPWCGAAGNDCKVQILDDRLIVNDEFEVQASQLHRIWLAPGVHTPVFLLYKRADGSLGRGVFIHWFQRDAVSMVTRLNEIWDNFLFKESPYEQLDKNPEKI